jgi:hypothetical protein
MKKSTDPIRATPVRLEGDTPAYRLTGHPEPMGYFLERLDGRVTECTDVEPKRNATWWTDRVEYLCPVFSSATRADLADELRKAADLSGVDLVIAPAECNADEAHPCDACEDEHGDPMPCPACVRFNRILAADCGSPVKGPS